ncbi:hypothetical protein PR202_gb12813 [Eleusine coracana subsp. coracana]|uniref:Uncharacterized protein n=1 Tax=Eleusine coracana subsp. coracana TaxID=191504 RepID=A0AAV5ER40_ELECO|nr:hypothetical protein PR202_gb12813 [Eleusine coracana subsp. coracana]
MQRHSMDQCVWFWRGTASQRAISSLGPVCAMPIEGVFARLKVSAEAGAVALATVAFAQRFARRQQLRAFRVRNKNKNLYGWINGRDT